MTSLLSTEKQQFSQDGLYGASWQQVVPDAKYPLPSQVHRILAATSATGRVVEDLVAAASSAAVSASVGTGLCISNVPYVAFEDLVDSSLSTLTVTYLSHVTEVLSPAFSAGTLFYKVNVTSLTCTVDASARSDAATGFKGDGKAAPAIFTVHSTAPAYQKIDGACLGPQCDHNNLHRARLLSALSWGNHDESRM